MTRKRRITLAMTVAVGLLLAAGFVGHNLPSCLSHLRAHRQVHPTDGQEGREQEHRSTGRAHFHAPRGLFECLFVPVPHRISLKSPWLCGPAGVCPARKAFLSLAGVPSLVLGTEGSRRSVQGSCQLKPLAYPKSGAPSSRIRLDLCLRRT